MTRRLSEVPLGEVVKHRKEFINVDNSTRYLRCRVRLRAQGVELRDEISGFELKTKKQQVCRPGEFLVAEIDAKLGGYGLVPPDLDGAIVSSHYFLFAIDDAHLEPRYLHWCCKTPAFLEQVQAQGSTNYAAIRPAHVLRYTIPLPALEEQRRIVRRIEAVAVRIEEARRLRRQTRVESQWLLDAAFRDIAQEAPRIALGEVAPLDRRPIRVDAGRTYPQIAVRSFGKGVFAKPPLRSDEITWQKPFLVRTGDILISNIKAWEGAIAVAGAEDDGRVASHRYLTFTPRPNVATARFLCFFLLTHEGLEAVGNASPGSADRNRTLSAKVLQQTRVPVPPIAAQLWFDQLIEKVFGWRRAIDDVDNVLDAIMPSVLRRAFGGEL